MVLEATMLVLDNSEWMRNGDFTPTRWDAQNDAVNIIFDAKTNSNPENMVGIMTMAGRSPEVLVTFTQDMGKIVAALHRSKMGGTSDISNGINVAQLALKHRQNKNQRQRIIVFVGSPIRDSEPELVRLAKKLKKNNVAIDIINFGEQSDNEGILTRLVDAANSGGNCHLITISAGPQLLSDVILSSPILMGEDEGGLGTSARPSGSESAGFDFGVDPSVDPELAMALRMSLQEEQARQRVPLVANGDDSVVDPGKAVEDVDEGVMLRRATHESSLQADLVNRDLDVADSAVPNGSATPTYRESPMAGHPFSGGRSGNGAGPSDAEEDLTEEEAIARAIAISLGQNTDTESAKKP